LEVGLARLESAPGDAAFAEVWSMAEEAPQRGGDMRKQGWLGLAATLAWLWAAFMAAGVVALGIPAVVEGRSLLVPALLLLFAVGLGASARGLRRRRHPYQWVAVCTSALLILYNLAFHSPASLVGIVVNLLILGIVVRHWREFTPAGPAADPHAAATGESVRDTASA
jgi:hypothetical protein